jgi:hypothetical protein
MADPHTGEADSSPELGSFRLMRAIWQIRV